jgi:transcriptional regulator with XRE-family HTH domain
MTTLKGRVGGRVREIRKARRLTQMELADKVSLSLNMIGCIERGEKFPSATTFEKLAEALKVMVQDFFAFPSVNPAEDKEREQAMNQLKALIADTPSEFIKSITEILAQTNKMAKHTS